MSDKPLKITTQEEADEAFGKGSIQSQWFREVMNPRPRPANWKRRVFGLASLSAEEYDEFSRCVDDAILGTEEESAEAQLRIIELANKDDCGKP